MYGFGFAGNIFDGWLEPSSDGKWIVPRTSTDFIEQLMKNTVLVASNRFDKMEERKMTERFAIKKVVFNNPATIILWTDGTKTIVKCGEGETYDAEKGFAMAICKKLFGNKGNYYNIFKKWIKEEDKG